MSECICIFQVFCCKLDNHVFSAGSAANMGLVITLAICSSLHIHVFEHSIFLEGNKILFRVGLALLYLHAKEILGMTDYQSLYTLLKGMAQGMHDCDLLMKVLNYRPP